MAAFSDYAEHDGLGLARLIAGGDVTPEEVLEAAIARADAVNPTINAIVHRMDAEARGRVAADLPQGPFAGVPFLLKDLYMGYEGAPLGNGSRLWQDYASPADFTYTRRCRAAGLVVFGKTNTPELGVAWTTEPVANGPTRNPWDLERSAGGSSGGAAAAVAAGIVPVAHATDGGGSIRIPAANCGLFGLKPTRGRNPAGPFVGEGWSGLATGHVVSRSVRDSAAMLDATSGPAPGDPYAAPPPARPFLQEVGTDPGRLRVALHTTGLDGRPLDPENRRAAEEAARLLQELGHEVDEAMPTLDVAAISRAFRVIIAGNLWNAVALRYDALGRRPDGYGLEKATWAWAEEGRSYTAADYAAAVTAVHVAGRQLAAFFESWDVMLSTTMREPPVKLGVLRQNEQDLDDYYRLLMDEMPVTPLFNATGCPAMSVPLHWTADGLPVGIHIGAAFGREDLLIRLASQLEQARPWFDRVPAL
ncbi:6-aminohexanoate-cyclic-dimer hydrolase [Thalassobaculum fulvum]|uniref:6-aminohexanoate-cyclic-dimer hydrolase n=1 Tax=Thalassobaculum fulvum TaxID=1633335 RepID=A0A918XRF2_9PROT|nr:amidase [Thalassobaculum fulvum]GHD49374.1 6-aminohexanoate-cyclic-dimer hydrolase [Thalassobaculum fulvum]